MRGQIEACCIYGPLRCGDRLSIRGQSQDSTATLLMFSHVYVSAGKTTLLDVISGRKNSGQIDGDVLYGISKASKSFLARNTGRALMLGEIKGNS